MQDAICIDFGTSSIRAAIRLSNGSMQVLPLGRTTSGRELDLASIPSEICINESLDRIMFGERALRERRIRKNSALAVRSAKLWISEPHLINTIVFRELGLSRKDLLVGLLGHALKIVKKTVESEFHGITAIMEKISIARPIWNVENTASASDCFSRIFSIASTVTDLVAEDSIELAALKVALKESDSSRGIRMTEVLEPAAAALTVIQPDPAVNMRRLVLLVDVGAGTTDLGMFQFVESAGHDDRLIMCSKMRSVFCAGDHIDNALLTFLKDNAAFVDDLELRKTEDNIRLLKQALFTSGSLLALGVKVDLADLTETDALKEMSRSVRQTIEEIIFENEELVLQVTKAAAHQNQFIEVVMAGGGAKLGFLTATIQQSMKLNSGAILTFKVRQPSNNLQIEQYEADITRLAVCLGGVDPDYTALVTSKVVEADLLIPSLGRPKQEITTLHAALEKTLRSDFKLGAEIADLSKREFHTRDSAEKDKWDLQRRELSGKVKTGSADAQYQLGKFLLTTNSDFCAPYLNEGIRLLVSAASQGRMEAALQLALLYSNNSNRSANASEALYWFYVWRKVTDSNSYDEHITTIEESLSGHDEILTFSRAMTLVSKLKVARSTGSSAPKVEVSTAQRSSPRNYDHRQAVSPNGLPSKIKVLELRSRLVRLKPPTVWPSDRKGLIRWAGASDGGVFEAVVLACLLKQDFNWEKFLNNNADKEMLNAWIRRLKEKN